MLYEVITIRGPGELLGTRQSGIPDFRVANLLRDGILLEAARREAFEIGQRIDFDVNPTLNSLRATLHRRWGGNEGGHAASNGREIRDPGSRCVPRTLISEV